MQPQFVTEMKFTRKLLILILSLLPLQAHAANVGPAGTQGQAQYNNGLQFAGTPLLTVGSSGLTIGTSTFTTPIGQNSGGTGAANFGDAYKNLTGVLNASSCANSTFHPAWCSGSEIGAWITAAATFIGNNYGMIITDPSLSYNQTTPAIIGVNIILECQGSTLKWGSTSGAQIVAGGDPTKLTGQVGGFGMLNHCALSPTVAYTTGHTNIGVYVGGDPSGVISPSTNYGPGFAVENSSISGFYRGWTHGNNAWVEIVDRTNLYNNYDNMYFPSGLSNAGERMEVSNSNIYQAINCGVESQAYEEWNFDFVSLDYNGTGGTASAGQTAMCGTQIIAHLNHVHLEQNNGPFVKFSGPTIFSLTNSTTFLANATGTESGIFEIDDGGTTFTSVTIDDLTVQGNHTPNYLIFTNGLSFQRQDVRGIKWQSTGSTALQPNTDATSTSVLQSATIINNVGIGQGGISIGTSGAGFGQSAPTNGLIIQGNVGIGTNNPTSILDVYKNVASTDLTSIICRNAASGNACTAQVTSNSNLANVRFVGTGASWYAGQLGTTAFSILDSTNSKTPFVIAASAPTNSFSMLSTGALGLGTASPATVLDVNGDITMETGTAGALLCLTSAHALGHCTAAASCTGTCTCTCAAN